MAKKNSSHDKNQNFYWISCLLYICSKFDSFTLKNEPRDAQIG